MKVADDNIHPIPLNERTTGVGGAFFLWFGITFTMVVMFTGYYFIPTLGFWKSSVAVILGSILGGIPFLTISLIGQKTGLPTTTLSRGTFGVNAVSYTHLPDLDEKCGYWGEKIALYVQTLGMNTCWVAMTYSKRKAHFTIEAGEKLCLVIAVGYGLTQGIPHKSKPDVYKRQI